jgi:Icc-related predicted phosphoesterase
MIVDCISDLHGFYPELEGGDLLIVAGDLTRHDTTEEHIQTRNWMRSLNYKKVIFIAGNHDNWILNAAPHVDAQQKTEYLCDSGTEFRFYETTDGGINFKWKTYKIWGSPWTKSFPGMNPKCKAFTLDTEEELAEKWKLIPDDIDILVTHSPSFGNLDSIKDYHKGAIFSSGSLTLWMLMTTLQKKLKLHVCGHIHEGYGQINHFNGIQLVNASHVNEYYEPVNKPIRVIL